MYIVSINLITGFCQQSEGLFVRFVRVKTAKVELNFAVMNVTKATVMNIALEFVKTVTPKSFLE